MDEENPVFQDVTHRVVPVESIPTVALPAFDGDDELFGRRKEMEVLRDCFVRACQDAAVDKNRELTLVSGPSGSGKTVLVVWTLKALVEEAGGFFLIGKFDQQERPESFYPVVQAITQLVTDIRKLEDKSMIQQTKEIVSKLVLEDRILVDRIPALKELLETKDTKSDIQTPEAEQVPSTAEEKRMAGAHAETRLIYSTECLLRGVTKTIGPVVLLIDDLQWSDRPTLNFLESIVQQGVSDKLFLVGTCRGNEVSIQHHLAVVLRELEANGVWINSIELENLSISSISEMIEKSCAVKKDISDLLAERVKKKTHGNALYVALYLRYLASRGVLRQTSDNPSLLTTLDDSGNDCALLDSSAGKHEGDAVAFLVSSIQQLPLDFQTALMYASCFGSAFDRTLLEHVTSIENIKDIFRSLESFGYIQMLSDEKGRFMHDQIQKAASGLQPREEIEAFHLEIGRKLWRNLPKSLLDNYIFDVVEQLRLGARLISDEAERTRLSIFLLRAGEKATKTSSFVQAAAHLNLAIDLLPKRHWRDDYFLSLDLYNAAAEVEYCNGNFGRMDELIDAVLQNGRSEQDKMRATMTRIFAQSSRDLLLEATELGLATLRDLSISLPPRVSMFRLIINAAKTKRMLKRFSDSEILSLPAMEDNDKRMAVRVMNLTLAATVFASPTLTVEMSLLIIRMTLKDGICGDSCIGFAVASWLFCYILNDAPLGFRLAQLSLRILEKFGAREWLARASPSVYGLTFTLFEPLRQQLKPLLLAHRVGLGSGDIEQSLISAGFYALIGLNASVPLDELISDAKPFIHLAKMHKQTKSVHYISPTVQLAINLSRPCDNPCLLTGEVMDEEMTLKECKEAKNEVNIKSFYISKLTICCIFQDYQQAEDVSHALKKYDNYFGAGFSSASGGLCEGITSLALYDSERKRRRSRVANSQRWLKQLQSLSKYSAKNFWSKVCILEGELAFVKDKDLEKALQKFDDSIRHGNEMKLYSDVGMAAERAANALRRSGRGEDADKYTMIAIEAYSEWGAFAKVAQIRNQLKDAYSSTDNDNGLGCPSQSRISTCQT